MDRTIILGRLEAEIDRLADIEHERWAHWQRYVHSQAERGEGGSLVLPAKLVEQWERQIATPYLNLSDEEKSSDKDQVRKYLPTIADVLSDE